VGPPWPGMVPVEAQIVTSSAAELNLSQESQEVRSDPGKNVWAEWMESAEQPATPRQARTSSSRRMNVLLSGLANELHVGDENEGGSSPRIHVIRTIKPRKKQPAGRTRF